MCCTLNSMSFVSCFWERVGDSGTKASFQLPSAASGVSGEVSESEGGCNGVEGLRGNTESVSESELWLDGEQAFEDSVAFRFSAGKQKHMWKLVWWSIKTTKSGNSVCSKHKNTNKSLYYCVCLCSTCWTSHPLAELQPAARSPAAAPPSAAGRAVAARPARRPAAHSERRAPRRSAASPPGWSRSAGPGSADSLKHKYTGFTDHVNCWLLMKKQIFKTVRGRITNKRRHRFRVPWSLWIFWMRASAARFSSSDSLVYSSSSSGQLSREDSQITSSSIYTLIYVHNTQTCTHLSTASLMSLIQVFLSSLDDVWTSYISGPAADALMRNIPLSSFATSRTINFCRAMTGGFWSWGALKSVKE